jgi:hypothetical protein
LQHKPASGMLKLRTIRRKIEAMQAELARRR